MEIQLFNKRFEDVLPTIKFDAIITDPPYPDYMAEEYHYYDGLLDWVKNYNCPQIIFWSAKVDFPLDYTAKHIWDKKCGVGSMYEIILERNGGKAYKVYNHYFINSTVAASFAKDEYYDHPSQKPLALMRKLVLENTKEGDTIFDPFMGSGSTALAAIMEGRNFIGCELNEKYFKMVEGRLSRFKNAPTLF
jgi:DNA modification methylase